MGELGRRTGFVKVFKYDKGYGFIECDDDHADVFCHIDHTVGEGYRRLNAGQQVTFFVVQSERGPQARQVMLLDENGERQPVPTASALTSRPAHGGEDAMPRPTFARLTDVALRDRDKAVQEQREAYLKDLASRAPNWVAAAREEQAHERQQEAAPKSVPEPAHEPAHERTVLPPIIQDAVASARANEEKEDAVSQGQRTYVLAALDQIQQLAKRAERPGALIQIRRLAANVELIIEAPDSTVARSFGDKDALNFDW